MATKHKIAANDGHILHGFVSRAQRGAAKGGVIVLHAVYGLTPHMGQVCDRWAAAGYDAIAPALFDRLQPDLVHAYDQPAAGVASYNALTDAQIFADVLACATEIGGVSRAVISGFCTGGTWAWRAAAEHAFAAQVNFYGSAIPAFIDLEPRCPTILHYGDRDHVVTREQALAIASRHPDIETHIYEGAGHAFENDDQPTYDATACDLAWRRSIAFLDRTLA